ncbi:unnamed protein product [Chondrus crispus]|uniref:Uncharacterized protein n=1 Tax=Chondrus crispus TaxID=2769 RepID=R7QGN2_CHOCR|nr:unnamed protein product [Chondrus crispus]CDF37677.1 unnamed protein product [Chondrus crispus]|eukprot:XP_005717548.1 unnamed protein product [Chondrus crispus]
MLVRLYKTTHPPTHTPTHTPTHPHTHTPTPAHTPTHTHTHDPGKETFMALVTLLCFLAATTLMSVDGSCPGTCRISDGEIAGCHPCKCNYAVCQAQTAFGPYDLHHQGVPVYCESTATCITQCNRYPCSASRA